MLCAGSNATYNLIHSKKIVLLQSKSNIESPVLNVLAKITCNIFGFGILSFYVTDVISSFRNIDLTFINSAFLLSRATDCSF